RSSPEPRHPIDVEVEPAPAHRHDQPEADDDLGGGDGHDGEREDLPVVVALLPRERDQGEVRAVEHDLEREEHDQRAPAQQDAEGAGREEERGDAEVPRDLRPFHCLVLEWAPRMTPPTAATSSTTDVI